MQMTSERKPFLKPEVLAPCGSEESVRAAVNCGADAVYLGQQAFNARQNRLLRIRYAFATSMG